ncbi:MAG TPA: hypothetical protein VLA76_06310 [Candidatus Angelobacter sp.]|nr:hypothetical protein [Candidatus Angelobacter sp.]
MIGPSRISFDVATTRHQERLHHAATIREIQQSRRDQTLRIDRQGQRRMTVRRLTHAMALAKAALHF